MSNSPARSTPSWKFTCGAIALIFGYWTLPGILIELFFPQTSAETRAYIALGMWLLFFAVIFGSGLFALWQKTRGQKAAQKRLEGFIPLSSGVLLSDDGEIEVPHDPLNH